jgi:hypothetical protein
MNAKLYFMLLQILNCRGQAFQYCNDNTVNSNTFFTYQNNEGGTVGLAWVGTVCSGNLSVRASMNEWFSSDMTTGWVTSFLSKIIIFLDRWMQLESRWETFCSEIGNIKIGLNWENILFLLFQNLAIECINKR